MYVQGDGSVGVNANNATRVELSIGPGHAYQAMVFGVAAMLLLEAVIFLTGGRSWHLLPAAAVAGLLLLGALRLRRPRLLVVDGGGIRLSRGKRIVKKLPWQEIVSVRHGPQELRSWVYVPHEGYSLEVRAKGSRRRVYIDTVHYGVSSERLAVAATEIARIAHVHGVPVYSTKDVLQTWIAERMFGPRVATIFVGGAILVGLVFAFFASGLVLQGDFFVSVVGSVVFGSFFLLLLYGALTVRRAYCDRCEGFRLFYRRKGQLRCEECEGALVAD